jgi:hypothetical protein
MNKYDKRRKYFLVLDCETATLPHAINYIGEQRKNVAIAKPLIYDLGWQVIDYQGRVYAKKNFLISEIFSVPAVFDTAYYAEKRPLYLEKLNRGEIMLTDWRTAVRELIEDMDACEAVGAYNSMFDFKKAIPFTELYINQLYSPDFHKWLDFQNSRVDAIATGRTFENPYGFDETVFRFREKTYPLFDLWGLSCRHILNCDEYKEMCLDNEWQTASGKYFKTSAETAFRFFSGDMEFIEAHTAIDDAVIESMLFADIVKRTKRDFEMGIIFFPFRELGTVERYRERSGRWN